MLSQGNIYNIKYKTYGYGIKPFKWLYQAKLLKIIKFDNDFRYTFLKNNKKYVIYLSDILNIGESKHEKS